MSTIPTTHPASTEPPFFHPDLAPYDQRCNETTGAAEAARKRYEAAVAELRAATLAHRESQQAEAEANTQWHQACQAFRELHGLGPNADLGYAATRHLPVHG